MSERVKRPFWLHQIAEYIVGAALIGSGLQSPSPAIPAVLGGLVLVNAACADAPLSAFRIANRRWHRIIDIALLVIGILATASPGLDLGTRIVQGCCVVVFATVVLNTNYSPAKDRRSSMSRSSNSQASGSGDRADEFGRSAGRVAGTAAAKARATWRARHDGDAGPG